jgi:hypothetical protein
MNYVMPTARCANAQRYKGAKVEIFLFSIQI